MSSMIPVTRDFLEVVLGCRLPGRVTGSRVGGGIIGSRFTEKMQGTLRNWELVCGFGGQAGWGDAEGARRGNGSWAWDWGTLCPMEEV